MSRRPWLEWTLVGLILLVLGAVLWPVSTRFPLSQDTLCLSNLKQLALGAIIYSADCDDRLMDRDRWMDQLTPQVQIEFYGHCPVVEKENEKNSSLYGYAFNSRLHQLDLKKIADPVSTPMLYESINLARNASDPFTSLPDPERHGSKEYPRNAITFADGHAAALPNEKARWLKP